MKLAILFSGRIHRFQNHFTNIMDSLVQENDVDFFLSQSPELNEDLELFTELYNPRVLNNDPLELFNYMSYRCPDKEHRPTNILSMFYNRKRVFQDFKKHIQTTQEHYDLVLSHRLDLYCYETLDFSLAKHGLCIPDTKSCGLFDQFAFGTLNTMEPYMTVYDHLESALQAGCPFNAEILLKTILENTTIHRFPFKTQIICDTSCYIHKETPL